MQGTFANGKYLVTVLFCSYASAAYPQSTSNQERRAQDWIGPSFSCPRPSNSADQLANVICNNRSMSRTDLVFSQAYYALRYQVGLAGQADLKAEALRDNIEIQRQCRIQSGGSADQYASPHTEDCYNKLREQQHQLLISRLHGAAREEALRPIEQHIKAQQALLDLGFLSPGNADGVYGASVRVAIETWQRVAQKAVTGFLSDRDVVALLSTSPSPTGETQPNEASARQRTFGATPAPPSLPLPLLAAEQTSNSLPNLSINNCVDYGEKVTGDSRGTTLLGMVGRYFHVDVEGLSEPDIDRVIAYTKICVNELEGLVHRENTWAPRGHYFAASYLGDNILRALEGEKVKKGNITRLMDIPKCDYDGVLSDLKDIIKNGVTGRRGSIELIDVKDIKDTTSDVYIQTSKRHCQLIGLLNTGESLIQYQLSHFKPDSQNITVELQIVN